MIEIKIAGKDLISKKPYAIIGKDILFFSNKACYTYTNFELIEVQMSEEDILIQIPNSVTELIELIKVKEFFYLDLISRDHKKYKKILKHTKKEILNFKKAYKDIQ